MKIDNRCGFQCQTFFVMAGVNVSEVPMSPDQCRAARGLLDWPQARLAEQARVGLSTVRNFEAGRSAPMANNLSAMITSLEAAGVQFIPENGGGAGVRLLRRATE